MRNRSAEQARSIGSVDPGEPTTRPVAELRIRARLYNEWAEERIIWGVPRRDIVVPPDWCFGALLPDCDDAAEQKSCIADPPHLNRPRSDVDDDPILHRVQVDQIATHPAPPTIRPSRQAELEPPAPLGIASSPDREDDLELRIGPNWCRTSISGASSAGVPRTAALEATSTPAAGILTEGTCAAAEAVADTEITTAPTVAATQCP